MIEGVDYSSSRPGGAALAAAGKRFAVRYVPYQIRQDFGGPLVWVAKGLTVAERDDLLAHHVAIALVFESTADRMLGGHAAGIADAQLIGPGLAHCGMPFDSFIYFACDFDAQPAQYATIDAYLAGAASVLGAGRVGIYAGYHVVEHCRRTAAKAWQTYAWSGGRLSSFASLYQYRNGQSINGASVDYDRALVADYGQYPRVVIPPDTSTGDHMATYVFGEKNGDASRLIRFEAGKTVNILGSLIPGGHVTTFTPQQATAYGFDFLAEVTQDPHAAPEGWYLRIVGGNLAGSWVALRDVALDPPASTDAVKAAADAVAKAATDKAATYA